MLKSPLLLAISVLVVLMQWAGRAQAQETSMGLSFELPPAKPQAVVPKTAPKIESEPSKPPVVEIARTLPLQSVSVEETKVEETTSEVVPLQYSTEDLPPIALSEDVRSPQNENTQNENIGLNFAEHNISEDVLATEPVPHSSSTDSTPLENNTQTHNSDNSLALLFSETHIEIPELSSGLSTGQPTEVAEAFSVNAAGLGDWIFDHGTESLVARTVGSAEGTRHWDGRKTEAYYGHVDPGNGVWNLGTFSYQHDATGPEDADDKQLRRLQRQGAELESQAADFGIQLSLEEKLNGLDLANQAPLAALAKGGYIERLAQAHRLQMTGDEAILWARTHSYMDPDTRRWNAPGLGNTVHGISKDQERRIVAIQKALTAFEPAGSSSVALDHLEEISLENAGIAAHADEGMGAIAAEDSLGFANVEVSFSLPPADQTLIAALSTPATPIVEATPVAEMPDLETKSPASEVDADEVVASSESQLGVTFLASDDIDIDTPLAQSVEQEATDSAEMVGEATEEEEQLVDEPVADEAITSEPEAITTETVVSEQPEGDLFSLRSQPTAISQPADSEAIAADPTKPENTTEPESRLQSLLNGILPRNQQADDTLESTSEEASEQTLETPLETTAEPADSSAEAAQSFWRTEDKVVDQK